MKFAVDGRMNDHPQHPLVPKTSPVYGYISDVKTGKLADVDGAKALGAVGK